MRRAFLLLAPVIALTGCSSPTHLDPAYDPRGTWTGMWESEDGLASGTIRLDFHLEPTSGGATQQVHVTATGATCGPGGDVGDGAYASEPTTLSFFVGMRDAGSPAPDTSGVSFIARAERDRLEGSYSTAAFGNCQHCGCDWGPRGSWSATRVR